MRRRRVGAGVVVVPVLLVVGGCGVGDGTAENGGPGTSGPAVEEGALPGPAGPLAFVRVGEGPATLVVHGGPGLDHRYLRPGVDALATGRSLVYYDQRGVGASVPTDGPLDSLSLGWEGTLADLDALADRFGDGGGRVAVLAHSWGALPALAWALARPERVRALVLVSPVEPGRRFQDETARRRARLTDPALRARLDSLVALAAGRRDRAAFRSELLRAAFRATAPDPAALERLDLELRETTARNGDLVARRVMGGAADLDLWGDLAGLDAPVLVLHGAGDVGPPDMARALADSLPLGEAVVLEGVGHFPFVEAPERFAAVVDAFLNRAGHR